MKLQEILGDKYKEGMTIEEIEAALADLNLVDPDTLPKSVTKEVFDKTASKLAKVQKELEALKEANMTAEEKLQAERNKAQAAQSYYKKELSKLRAKEIFIAAGLVEKDYEGILDVVVSEDETVTKTRATTMVELIKNQKKAAEDALRAELLKNTPTPPGGKGSEGMTKEEFSKLGLIEKQKFAIENPDKYREFYKED